MKVILFADDYFLSVSVPTWPYCSSSEALILTVAQELLAGHPQGEGDEEGGQGGAGGNSQTRHGQESQQRCQQDVTLVPDQRLQPLTELEERE